MIVNVASILGQETFAGAPAYVASKQAVVGPSMQIANEYAAAGIRALDTLVRRHRTKVDLPPPRTGATVDALNTLRAILVAFAAVAAILLGVRGEWTPALVLAAGIAAHGALWVYLWRQRRRDSEQAIAGFEQLLAENG